VVFIHFFFNDTSCSEFYTLSLHDALPIWGLLCYDFFFLPPKRLLSPCFIASSVFCCVVSVLVESLEVLFLLPPPIISLIRSLPRSEEHTSELQSRENLVCRLLLEIKKFEL